MMTIHFILVEPSVPGNIGASARAIKTMGFGSLRLVKPHGHRNEQAQWLAHGAVDILEQARVYQNLEDAVADCDLVIGTTARKRLIKHDYYPAHELPGFILNKQNSVKNCALVFGREDTGLLNTELALCDIVSSVPLNAPYPSLNLSQAVMIYAYSVSSLQIQHTQQTDSTPDHQEKESLHVLQQKISQLLARIDIPHNSLLHNRIIERLGIVSDTDIHLLFSVWHKMMKKLTVDEDRKDKHLFDTSVE